STWSRRAARPRPQTPRLAILSHFSQSLPFNETSSSDTSPVPTVGPNVLLSQPDPRFFTNSTHLTLSTKPTFCNQNSDLNTSVCNQPSCLPFIRRLRPLSPLLRPILVPNSRTRYRSKPLI